MGALWSIPKEDFKIADILVQLHNKKRSEEQNCMAEIQIYLIKHRVWMLSEFVAPVILSCVYQKP